MLARCIAGGLAVVTLVVALIATCLSVYTIDEVKRGVVLRGGQIIEITEPGWHVKMPIVDTVEEIWVRVAREEIKDMVALTRTQQAVTLRVSASYRVPPDRVADRYRQLGLTKGTWEAYIKPLLYTSMKTEISQVTPEEVLTQREALLERVVARIRAEIGHQGWAVELLALRLEDLQFSPEYQAAQEALRAAEALGSLENLLALKRVEKWNGVLPSTPSLLSIGKMP